MFTVLATEERDDARDSLSFLPAPFMAGVVTNCPLGEGEGRLRFVFLNARVLIVYGILAVGFFFFCGAGLGATGVDAWTSGFSWCAQRVDGADVGGEVQ